MAKDVMEIEIMGVLPASFVYSFIIAFFFLKYFSKKKENNKSWIIFIVATLHLSLIFVLPVIILIVLEQRENISIKFENNVTKWELSFKIMSITNHILNKLVYPASIIYYESGFVSNCYKFIPLTFKGWINWVSNLWIIPVLIILGIAYLLYKEEILDYYKNVLVYYLNYLNIIDLINLYFELGFSIMDSYRYCCRTCCKFDVYEKYIKGKIKYHKQQLDLEFENELKTLSSITNLYSEEIRKYKLTEIFAFVTKHEKFLTNKDNYDSKTDYSSQTKINNITDIQLEKLISSSHMEVKKLGRKIVRINNLYDIATKKLVIDNWCQCIKCLSSSIFEIIKLSLFIFICLLLFLLEIEYYKQYKYVFFEHNNSTNATNISYYFSEIDNSVINNTNNTTNTTNTINYKKYSLGAQIFSFFFAYIILLPALAITTGVYLIPIIYAVVKRRFITGEYIYEKGLSNNLEIISSVQKITSNVSASMYLGALLYIHIILKDKPTSDNYKEFFKFFDLPYTEAVLAIKMIFLVFVMIITNREYINFGCYELNIADEGTFYLPITDSWCYKLFEGRKEKYFKLAEEKNEQNDSPQKIELLSMN